ncbi:hypothetical protein FACS189430_09530 [Bacteroidia bacterium]|nr:hypothetical protein FACS189430_09530 [Bacteroidia bacterium]
MLAVCPAIWGQQRQLVYQDKSGKFDVFSGGSGEAGVVVFCPEEIELTFASSKDPSVDLYKTEVKGSDKYYYMRFQTGKRYEGRKLTVYASKYAPLILTIELESKEFKTLHIYDPDVILLGCYNQTMKDADVLFRLAQYADARAKYKMAVECSDKPKMSNEEIEERIKLLDTLVNRRWTQDNYKFLAEDFRKANRDLIACTVDVDIIEKINNIDTLVSFRRIADKYFLDEDFRKAYINYMNAYNYNNADQYIGGKLMDCQVKLAAVCRTDFTQAEAYFKDRWFTEAEGLYYHLIDQACPTAPEAKLRLQEITLKRDRKLQRTRVLTYEFAGNVPIGFSTGGYKNRKTGAYFTLRTNTELFDALRDNNAAGDKAELDMSFGWTRRLFKFTATDDVAYPFGVWLTVGIGGVAASRYTVETLSMSDFAYAVAPEAGLTLKLGVAALRYTLQYRYWTDRNNIDPFGALSHVGGIGICF